jgi:EAL domain-containing protein (putative c-di-GMP-specific phosphodiesterase class I)
MKYDCAGINTIKSARALASTGNFKLELQPIVKFDEKRLASVEAFGYFEPKTLQSHGIAPEEMACLVRYRELGQEYDLQVLEKALAAVNRIEHNHGLVFPVAINICEAFFRSPDFVTRVWQVLEQTRVQAHRIQFEVSEAGLNREPGGSAMVSPLIRNGFDVVVDEFIAGDSDFGALIKPDIRTIKIDPSVSHELTGSEVARRFVRALSVLAESLDKKMLVDGVENYQQCVFLQAIGCSYLQGSYVAGRLKEHELADFARRFLLGTLSASASDSRSGLGQAADSKRQGPELPAGGSDEED